MGGVAGETIDILLNKNCFLLKEKRKTARKTPRSKHIGIVVPRKSTGYEADGRKCERTRRNQNASRDNMHRTVLHLRGKISAHRPEAQKMKSSTKRDGLRILLYDDRYLPNANN